MRQNESHTWSKPKVSALRTELVDDLLGQPVVVHVAGGAGLERARGGARGLAARQRRQRLLAQHQRQHAARAQEHVQEERLAVQPLRHLHDVQRLVVHGLLRTDRTTRYCLFTRLFY